MNKLSNLCIKFQFRLLILVALQVENISQKVLVTSLQRLEDRKLSKQRQKSPFVGMNRLADTECCFLVSVVLVLSQHETKIKRRYVDTGPSSSLFDLLTT